MKNKTILAVMIVMLGVTACSSSGSDLTSQASPTQSTSEEAVQSAPVLAEVETNQATSVSPRETHTEASDYLFDSTQTTLIALNDTGITTQGNGVTINGNQAVITTAGTYSISGSLTDGQILVDATNESVVRLILNGVDIRNSTTAPIVIESAGKTVIILAEGSVNQVSDAANYIFDSGGEDEPNAAIFSKSDLTIYGSGSLTVQGNFNDGIASKDGLIISSGNISVSALDDGIRGKDYLVVEEGTLSVDAGGDGLKADNTDDTNLGFLTIQSGVFTISADGDAITAESDVEIAGGQFTIDSGGDASAFISEDISAKGIKGQASVSIAGGTFNINSADDAIHSNGEITIDGGDYHLLSADDGMHADARLTINEGEVSIDQSYEGLESAIITINGGNIDVIASDDGINVAGGNAADGMAQGTEQWINPEMPQAERQDLQPMPQPEQRQGPMAGRGGGPGQDAFAASGNYFLYINGGHVHVDAGGDGIDVNGSIEMKDGLVLVDGPTEQMNGALDCIGAFNISGGYLIAVGSAGMAEAPDESSSQNSVLVNLQGWQQAGTLVHVQDSSGKEIFTFAPAKSFQSIVFSTPDLQLGETYDLYLGGSFTGSLTHGLYQGDSYTSGTRYQSISITSAVSMLGSGGSLRR